jgi:NAD-dependent SIR2 family protein deacetylase
VSSPEIPLALQYGIDQARELLSGRRVVALTGAGVSTDSGIPDYRGAGRQKRHPLTFEEFLGSEENQARYWARSYFGWRQVETALPNRTHQILAGLEQRGIMNHIITQNVDGLHQKAGSKKVIELHGRLDQVLCLSCGDILSRNELDSRINNLNPELIRDNSVAFAPDGDADVAVPTNFRVPNCGICGGKYKPDVVFFGENVPAEKVQRAQTAILDAEAVIVAGSSLTVNSGLKLVKQAKNRGLPIVIINLGETKADSISDVKLNASVANCLEEIF